MGLKAKSLMTFISLQGLPSQLTMVCSINGPVGCLHQDAPDICIDKMPLKAFLLKWAHRL